MTALRTALNSLLLVAVLSGCSSGGREIAAPVKVTGKVTLANGQPARDVMIYFQPLDTDGRIATLPLAADGSFSGDMVSGKYVFSLQPAEGKAAAHKAIPGKYRDVDMKHQVHLGSDPVEIKLEAN